MRCPKCDGFTVPEQLIDEPSGIYSDNAIDALKCVSCGSIYETALTANKIGSMNGQINFSRKKINRRYEYFAANSSQQAITKAAKK